MMVEHTGGQAFPCSDGMSVEFGMTLRDYFAAHASEGDIQKWANVVPNIEQVFDEGNGRKRLGFAPPPNVREIARYMHADAMLAAREK